MSLIEHARSLLTEVVSAHAPGGSVVETPTAEASIVDIARAELDEDALERVRREWAEPPHHR